MAGLGKSLVFDEGVIEGLVDMRYGDADVVPLLSVLSGHMHTGQAFHIDHIFPRAKLTPQRLRDEGYDESHLNRLSSFATTDSQTCGSWRMARTSAKATAPAWSGR